MERSTTIWVWIMFSILNKGVRKHFYEYARIKNLEPRAVLLKEEFLSIVEDWIKWMKEVKNISVEFVSIENNASALEAKLEKK